MISFPARPSLWIGVAAALASVAIGVTWQVATRLGATTTLAPIDLALFRYGVPALVLAPLAWRAGPAPSSPATLALMVLGAGFPFGLTAMAGASFAPAAHMGALLPGTMPLFVALLAALALGERFGAGRLAGFVLIVAGALAIGAPALATGDGGAWRGDLLFLLAAALWSVYTIAYRRSGLAPWTAAAVVSAWSFGMALPAWLLSGSGRLLTAPWRDILIQALAQGVVAGLGGLALYGMAVRHLGPSRAALSGALVPASAALAGWLVLGETVDGPTAFGIVAATSGVALAAGLLDRRLAGPARASRQAAAAARPSKKAPSSAAGRGGLK